eukprot:jgi/Mesvir1/24526/Mv21867-RA.1
MQHKRNYDDAVQRVLPPPSSKVARSEDGQIGGGSLQAVALDGDGPVRTCLHETVYPDGQVKGPTLKRRPADAKPARVYPFKLDPFQEAAIACLDANESVMVAAHTSAGKTVVAEYAIAMALRDGQRVVYTSPIKALSNQKYRELNDEFSDVGLMTGDVTINPEASCLVMTTEILRSMLYRGSEVVREVAWVIFDEVHYLRDKERGVVWEESIIMAPSVVRFVFLSATVPNANEFAEWVARLHRQPCHVVYTDFRPTPLQHYLFPAAGKGIYMVVDDQGTFREDQFHKAIAALTAAKEAAQTAAAAAAVAGKGKGKGGGPGQVAGEPSDIFKLVKMIMSRNFDPAIIFSFSKRECETLALQMSTLDLNGREEKKLIHGVFENAIDSLSDDDKKLPQVSHILPLLLRGIGVHHSGLLPILKEVIEILFQEGLLKVLFATETFSIGLNMPAKTCVFTHVRKYDGDSFRWISSGEYIQMSGRAGRRGLDDRGVVILMFDDKMDPAVAKGIVKGLPDRLNSAFHLSYSSLLNMARVEEHDASSLLQRSFKQLQMEKGVPALQARVQALEAELSTISIPDEALVEEYAKLQEQLGDLRQQKRAAVFTPLRALPGPDPGVWGVVVNFEKVARKKRVMMDDGEDEAGEATEEILIDVLTLCEKLDNSGAGGADFPGGRGPSKPRLARPVIASTNTATGREGGSGASASGDANGNATSGKHAGERGGSKAKHGKHGNGSSGHTGKDTNHGRGGDGSGSSDGHEPATASFDPRAIGADKSVEPLVVPVLLSQLDVLSSLRLHMPKDLRSPESRQLAYKSVCEVQRRFPKGLPLLDPGEDMGVKDDGLRKLSRRIESVEGMLEGHALAGEPGLGDRLRMMRRKQHLRDSIKAVKKEIKACQDLVLKSELKARHRVLRRLGYMDEDGVVGVKGQFACEITSGDELVLSEMIFNGVFHNLSIEEAVSLASCLVWTERNGTGSSANKLPEDLKRVHLLLRDTARRVGKASVECKLELDVEEYVDSFRPDLMEVVSMWCRGAKFHQICKVTEIFEGSLVRGFRRLEELLRQVCTGLHLIGEVDLEKKFEDGITRIKRDVVFAASLYL